MNRRVQEGPFKGMLMTSEQPWDDGNLEAKFAGRYERCLNLWVDTAITKQPKQIINVGCAEGYYAVGFALRCPETKVIAVDINPACVAACAKNSVLNNVGLTIYEGITAEDLSNLITPGTFIFMDCEGEEINMLNPVLCPNIVGADFIVECHDYAGYSISTDLIKWLSPSHTITPRHDQKDDTRPEGMLWLYGVVK